MTKLIKTDLTVFVKNNTKITENDDLQKPTN